MAWRAWLPTTRGVLSVLPAWFGVYLAMALHAHGVHPMLASAPCIVLFPLMVRLRIDWGLES